MSDRTTDAQLVRWRRVLVTRTRASDYDKALTAAIDAVVSERARADQAEAKLANTERRLVEAGATLARVRAQRDDARVFTRDDGLRP